MTSPQFHRWQSFALRMAHRGLGLRLRSSRKAVAGMVRDFFDYLPSHAEEGDVARLIAGINSWDGWANDVLICDVVSELEQDWNPFYWSSGHAAYERWQERWSDRARLCLRAGLDLATGTGPGVFGFTVGDLRRMYRGQIPEWIADGGWVQGDDRPVILNKQPDEAGVVI